VESSNAVTVTAGVRCRFVPPRFLPAVEGEGRVQGAERCSLLKGAGIRRPCSRVPFALFTPLGDRQAPGPDALYVVLRGLGTQWFLGAFELVVERLWGCRCRGRDRALRMPRKSLPLCVRRRRHRADETGRSGPTCRG
jgi:hypothetical protein